MQEYEHLAFMGLTEQGDQKYSYWSIFRAKGRDTKRYTPETEEWYQDLYLLPVLHVVFSLPEASQQASLNDTVFSGQHFRFQRMAREYSSRK